MAGEGFLAVLESDLRLLSGESRRAEGLAGQLTGWLSGNEYPQIKEAAERAALKLRSYAAKDDTLGLVRGTGDILKPFLAACEVKSPKLASISLGSIQKLLANDAVSLEDMRLIINALEQVERMRDEGVQLKMLQTALTLMQSPVLALSEEGVAAVLGLCFRLLSDSKNSDSVVNTAAATVRQAVALVFDHVEVQRDSGALLSAGYAPTASCQTGEGAGDGGPGTPCSPASRQASPHASSTPRRSTGSPRFQGPTNAALKLLDDLCMMATANEAMLKWLKAPALPRPFVLDLLDFVLANSVAVFRTIPAFEHALLVRICQLLITQLQNLLDPTCEPAVQSTDLKIVLRVVRTVMRHFYRQLRSKCGVFVETLLGGVSSSCSLWQRISVMQVMRHLCADAFILHFLFATYDMRDACKLNAVQQMVKCFAEIVDATTRVAIDVPEEDPVNTVAMLYHTKAQGTDWTLDSDYGNAAPEVGAAYLAMLAIDCLLGVVAAVEKLTDVAVEGLVAVTPEAAMGGGRDPVERETCAAMVQLTWRVVLSSLSHLLLRCSGEALVLQLLKGYQSMSQACGMLEQIEARDAFLASLCEFTLSSADDLKEEQPTSPNDATTSPASASHSRAASREQLSRSVTPRTIVLASDGSEGVVLTPKNVQALRTLFNIAHRLDALLGPSWVLVLDNLNSLDRILNSPRTTTQEISTQSTAGSLPSDLAILSTAANQLFQSTSLMSTEAVVSMLSSLRDVSAKSIPLATQAAGPPRLYALGRMVETLLYNMHRIHDLWGIFLSHLVEVLDHNKASIRGAAIEALGKAVTGALHQILPTNDGPAARPGAGEGGAGAGEDGGAVEHMLMVALEALYKDDQEQDVRMGILRVLLQVLQRHGERLSSGWVPVLRLLAVVPQGEEPATVGLAFQSVQLVCSDYLSSMQPHLLRKCLEVAALYGSQQADVNVSLTAIGLLWNAADLLGKLHSRAGQSPTPDAEAEPVSSNGDAVQPKLDSAQFEELVRMLFGALQGLSMDTRPEVRNSGVRTLYLVVVSQGGRLSSVAWDECLWEMLFPLLRQVYHMSATSSREEAKAEVLGKLKGVSVKMLIHHSRNSEQKQWDETLVLALSGMARLLRAHLPILLPMAAFPQGWEELMVVVESSMAGGRKETALAAIGLLTTVLQAHGNTRMVSRSMWKRAVRAMDVGVEAAAGPQCAVPLQARLELTNAIGQLYAALKEVFEEEDMRQLYRWLGKFVRYPTSEDDTNQAAPGTIPPVQKAALALFPTLAPTDLTDLWPDLFAALLALLQPAAPDPQAPPPEDAGAVSPAPPPPRSALTSQCMERVVEICVQLYRDQAPWQARAAMFPAIVSALGQCMATRYTAYADNLWRVSAAALSPVVNAGVPAINIAYVNNEQAPPEDAWPALAAAFETFLLGPPGDPSAPDSAGDASLQTPRVSETGSIASAADVNGERGDAPSEGGQPSSSLSSEAEMARQDAETEAGVLDTLTDAVLTACSRTPSHVRRRLVCVIDGGIVRPRQRNIPNSAAGARFAHLCLRKMYVLCSRGVEAQGPHGCLLEVAQLALPIFIARCDTLLAAFAGAVAAGSDQRDRIRLGELLCVLEVLASMTLSPAVADAAVEEGSNLQALVKLRRALPDFQQKGRDRTHLLLLYPALCRCIPCRDHRVHEMLRDVLQLAGAELGLLNLTAVPLG
ncbi:hypothetical protein WJX72_005196 [[Myrmecia] bisecta]|uniref:Protein MON2 homolog n=1 Tax=[Myrmecia] bisecta TaxID=41462 RepID=A0AAW1PL18_9CHLO